MPQAFTFDFNSDFDSDGDGDGNGNGVELDGHNFLNESQTDIREVSGMQTNPHSEEPKSHSLPEMLSLLPSSISYSTLAIDLPNETTPIQLLRRELFDIRTQLMAEDSRIAEVDEYSSNTLAGLSTGDDLTPGIYEGGFKTWECAIDLAQYLAGQWNTIVEAVGTRGLRVIELGAGTALPTLTLFHLILTNSSLRSSHTPIQLTLADYNPSVLQLSTIPNILLTHTLHPAHSQSSPSAAANSQNADIEINSSLLTRFSSDLSSRNIHISAISGPWSSTFVDLVTSQNSSPHATSLSRAFTSTVAQCSSPLTLILASETIYSPLSLQPFTNTLFALLDAAESRVGCSQPPRALVAAKKFYFGVGGGVEEFCTEVRARGGTADVVWESTGGVGRAIIEVRRGSVRELGGDG